jgi:succinylglutamic semialdehyde dehydrogenase
MKTNYIAGKWFPASGEPFDSMNPATEEDIWSGKTSSYEDVQEAVTAAHYAFTDWRKTSFQQRLEILQQFNKIVNDKSGELAKLISSETGKPLWDAAKEVQAVLGKLNISADAYNKRTGTAELAQNKAMTLRHQPHGVMAILGPYNFPCHLPNGHIIPALLAGNTVVFKPSELTPACGEFLAKCWHTAGLPDGVFNLIQGKKETGQALMSATHIAGVLFTGSEQTGKILHKHFAGRPEIMLALEMGGNNPLIIDQNTQLTNSVLLTLESAFISAGQRCTCARRVFIPTGDWGDTFLEQLVAKARSLPIGFPDCDPQPFMGTMISAQSVNHLLQQQQKLLDMGGVALIPCEKLPCGEAFVTPGIIDVTAISKPTDEEIFGPLLQIIRYNSFDQAIEQANQTRFGLAAGLISENESKLIQFNSQIRAGIVNWNQPLTGASSALPFGGVGCSGNHRPSAYYAADYCSFPVSGIQQHSIETSTTLSQYFSTINKANSHDT